MRIINSDDVLEISEDRQLDIQISSGLIVQKDGTRVGNLIFNEQDALEPLDPANGLGDAELFQNPLTVLSHELTHMEELIDKVYTEASPERFVINPNQPFFEIEDENTGKIELHANGIKGGEFSAVGKENKVRSEIGLTLRTHYNGINVFNKTPSSTKKSFGDKRKFNFPFNSTNPINFSLYKGKNKKTTPLFFLTQLGIRETNSKSTSGSFFNNPKIYGKNGGTTTLESN